MGPFSQQVSHMEESGVVLIRNAIPPGQVLSLRRELEDIFSQARGVRLRNPHDGLGPL